MKISHTLRLTMLAIDAGHQSLRELSGERDHCLKATRRQVRALQALGLITWEPYKGRTLQLTTSGWLYLHPPSGFRFLPVVRCRDGLQRALG